MEKHLVLFQVVSAGQNGAELGNDEEQIVYVLYTILNVEDNKVRDLWGISNFFLVFSTVRSFHKSDFDFGHGHL